VNIDALVQQAATTVEPYTFTVTDAARQTIIETMKRLETVSMLAADWDSYGAPAVKRTAVLMAMRLLQLFAESGFDPPQIVPMSNGGIQLEWHWSEADLEIQFTGEADVDAFIDIHGDTSWEGEFASAPARVMQSLARFAVSAPKV